MLCLLQLTCACLSYDSLLAALNNHPTSSELQFTTCFFCCLQHANRQQAPATAPDSPIVLDDAACTPEARVLHPLRNNLSYQPSDMSEDQQRLQNQEAAGNTNQAALAPGPTARFCPQFITSSGYSPGFKATPAFGHDFTAAAWNSPYVRSPSGIRAAQNTGSQRLPGRSSAKDQELDELMEALQMHVPYDPQAPLAAFATKRQGSTAELDLDEVLAR